jgi:hypothetical protein
LHSPDLDRKRPAPPADNCGPKGAAAVNARPLHGLMVKKKEKKEERRKSKKIRHFKPKKSIKAPLQLAFLDSFFHSAFFNFFKNF